VVIMPGMSEPPRDLAALSVEELRVALGRQRAVNTELRMVIATHAELHQAELAARDAQIAQLRSQAVPPLCIRYLDGTEVSVDPVRTLPG
jgi:hypothetical protein